MFDVLSDAEHDLIVVAGTDLDLEAQYAFDPDSDPPVDTFEGMWARGETELELVAACEQQIAFLHAIQCRALARFADLRPGQWEAVSKYAPDEIGVALRWTTRYASSRLGLAYTLTERLPGTLQALERGEVDLRRAQQLADITVGVPVAVARAVEEAVLPEAAGQNISQLGRAARKQVALLDPEGAAARHKERKKDRRVVVQPDDDGMAELSALLTAIEAEQIYHALDAYARACKTQGDTRSADERRADALCDLLLDPRHHHTTAGKGSGVQVHVTVPASTLMGLDDQPGDLAGYGPIPADLARELAAEGTWRRLVTDPLSGTLLDFGRTTYRPPAGLADFVRARDQRCVFPGCSRAAKYCDLDHNRCYPRGTTSACNIACLCKRHRRVAPGNRTPRLPRIRA